MILCACQNNESNTVNTRAFRCHQIRYRQTNIHSYIDKKKPRAIAHPSASRSGDRVVCSVLSLPTNVNKTKTLLLGYKVALLPPISSQLLWIFSSPSPRGYHPFWETGRCVKYPRFNTGFKTSHFVISSLILYHLILSMF